VCTLRCRQQGSQDCETANLRPIPISECHCRRFSFPREDQRGCEKTADPKIVNIRPTRRRLGSRVHMLQFGHLEFKSPTTSVSDHDRDKVSMCVVPHRCQASACVQRASVISIRSLCILRADAPVGARTLGTLGNDSVATTYTKSWVRWGGKKMRRGWVTWALGFVSGRYLSGIRLGVNGRAVSIKMRWAMAIAIAACSGGGRCMGISMAGTGIGSQRRKGTSFIGKCLHLSAWAYGGVKWTSSGQCAAVERENIRKTSEKFRPHHGGCIR
jgi:hypothetical protein